MKCRVRVWHYLDEWNGAAAVRAYEGPIIHALKKHAGQKQGYLVAEDNDPQGYKSNAAKEAKEKLRIRTVDWPRYSPDLNPLDFFLWAEVSRRMALEQVNNETAVQYKARLRATAMAIPAPLIRAALLSIKERAKMVVGAEGRDIPRD